MKPSSHAQEKPLMCCQGQIPALAKQIGLGESRSMMARLRNLLNSDSRGSALVEIALTLPLIMVLMTGIFSFSIALYQKLELAEAISVGGRFIAVDRGDTDPCKSTAAQIYSSAPTLSSANITLTFTLNGTPTGATCPGTAGLANANMTPGGTALITASYACTLAVYGFSYPGCTLRTEISEVVQ